MFRVIFFSFFVIFAAMMPSQAAAPSNNQVIDVYIMRGLFGFMFQSAGGVYRMDRELRAKGYRVMFTCWQDGCRNKIVQSIRAHPNHKFAIIGHSMGGNGVTLIGRELNKYGIKVPYAAVIDAPVPQPLTPNFGVVDNFYQFNDWRNPILKRLSSRTQLNQFNYRGKADHIRLANEKTVVNRIYSQIKKIIG